MDTAELFSCCRKGDLQKVQYLVEQKEVELNIRDVWDSTPLYYACLCGHEDVVRYLLENGAKCAANTFDGERCLYGSLTKEIRNLLKSYSAVSSKTLRRDLYEEFLRRLLERGMYEDITFHIQGRKYFAHRCILSVRCQYFAELFQTRWKDRRDVHLTHSLVSPMAFQSLLQYIYTGHMDIDVNYIDDCKRLAKQCKLFKLLEEIDNKYKKLISFESTKPGVQVTTLVIESEEQLLLLQAELGKLADLALPRDLSTFIQGELPFEPEYCHLYPDICFSVEGYRFLCHKAFFYGRSDYFKALLMNHFGETNLVEGDIPMVTLYEISADIFSKVMYYIYQNNCELTQDSVYDVLCCADLYMLSGLKRLCSNCICRYIMVDNVIQILNTARLFTLLKLEDQCAEFIANHLEEVIDLPQFKDLVRVDASEIKERQETDSIGIIDDIRFHITNFMQTYSDMEEANEKLKMIDDLLEELDIEG